MFLTVDDRRRKGGERERGRRRRRERKGKEGESEMEIINMGAKLTHSAAAVLECAQRECSGIAKRCVWGEGWGGGVQWEGGEGSQTELRCIP